MTPELIVISVVVFLVAGTVKGIAGIGLPSASLSLLVQFTDPRIAIALLLGPLLFSNIWQVYRGGRVWQSCRHLLPFAATCCVFTWLAARQVANIPAEPLIFILGSSIVLFAALNFLKPLPPILPRWDRPIQVMAGALAGVLGGLTAIWGPPMIMYLLAKRLSNDDFVRFTGFLFLVGSIPLLLGYWEAGLINFDLSIASLLMVAPTLIGFSLGERLRHRFDRQQFRLFVLILFAVMGLNLIRRAIF